VPSDAAAYWLACGVITKYFPFAKDFHWISGKYFMIINLSCQNAERIRQTVRAAASAGQR